jgi:hypothetical protein
MTRNSAIARALIAGWHIYKHQSELIFRQLPLQELRVEIVWLLIFDSFEAGFRGGRETIDEVELVKQVL